MQGVVQARAEDGRGMASVFGCSHDDDHVGVSGFVPGGLLTNADRQSDQVIEGEAEQQGGGQTGDSSTLRYSDLNIVQR